MRKALVVGIDNYIQCPLHGCCNDANRFKGCLYSPHEPTTYYCIAQIIVDEYDKGNELMFE